MRLLSLLRSLTVAPPDPKIQNPVVGGQRPGTSGGTLGTSGRPSVTTGALYAGFAAIAGVVAAVNIGSVLMEYPPEVRRFSVWEPVVWEVSSALAWLALAPLAAVALARWPPERLGLWRFFAWHLILSAPISLLHVIGMVALRHTAYWAAGSAYDFSHGEPLVKFFYEWRKDALTYGLLLAMFWLFQALFRQPRPAAREPEASRPLEVKADGRTHFIPPTELLYVEAAGNYVELRCVGGRILARGALSAFETRLAETGFARIHRGRLVNLARIRAVESTPAGDLRITLDTGETIGGSRRYRDRLREARFPLAAEPDNQRR